MKRSTNSFTTAMQRLSEAMGWGVESIGGQWRVTKCPHAMGQDEGFEGLTYSALALFSLLVRVANAPLSQGGLNWDRGHIRDTARIRLTRTLQGGLILPARASATDEATIYRLMKGSNDGASD